MAKEKKNRKKKDEKIKLPEPVSPDNIEKPFDYVLKGIDLGDCEPVPPESRHRVEGTRPE